MTALLSSPIAATSERADRIGRPGLGAWILVLADYPFLDLMWTMLVFFLWIAWFWTLFGVWRGIFRRRDLSGLGKTGWFIFTLVLPFLGVDRAPTGWQPLDPEVAFASRRESGRIGACLGRVCFRDGGARPAPRPDR